MGAFITLSAGVMVLSITILTYFRRPPAVLWPSLFLFSLSVTLWAFGELFTSYLTNEQRWYWTWVVIEYTGVLGLPPAWWILTLRYAELCGHRIRWSSWPMLYGPVAIATVFWLVMITNPIHETYMIAIVNVPNVRGALWYCSAIWDYAVIAASIAVLIWLSTKALTNDQVVQVRIMLMGAVLPLISNFLYLTRVVDFGFDITVATFSFLALLFSFGIYRHRLFALSAISLNHVIYNEPNTLFITDQTGRVCFANASAEALFWHSSNLVDSPIFPIMDAVFERADRPGIPPGFKSICNPNRTKQSLANGDLLRLRGTDRHFVFQQTTIPGWRKGILGFGVRLVEVTDAEHIKNQLAEHASAVEAILESVLEGILVVDLDGKMVFFNDVFKKMWNLPEDIVKTQRDEEAINHVLGQLVDPHAFVERIQNLYASSHESSNRDEIPLKDGRVFERSSRPLYNDKLPIGRVWTFRDVTLARKVTEERGALELKVLEAQKLDSLGLLAGGIAHDFNNILVGVLGNAELAMDFTEPHTELYSRLSGIVQASRRAGELCNQLLAYSGHGQNIVIPIDLSELVEDMESLLSSSVSKYCQVKMDLDDTLPAVEADVTQLRQIIMNLTTNASEAIGNANGEVTIRTGVDTCKREQLDEFIVDDVAPGEFVYIEVEVSGCGIDDELQRQMFEPFFSTKSAGRGLGLAAVRGIVRSHRAAIDVTTQEGTGTRIRVLFPASAAAIKSVRQDPPQEESSAATGTVLVVDDEPQVLDVMKRILCRAGYTVVTASDGHDAMNIFRQRHEELQVVVLEMTMPRLNGKEVYEQMREITVAIPIVLASGYSEQEVIEHVGDANAPHFLQKPFESKELLQAVSMAIRATK